MFLEPAVEKDYPCIVELANTAFRGKGAAATWNSEAEYISGDRLTEVQLRRDLAEKPLARLLTYRELRGGEVLGTVWLEPKDEVTWYLGLLAVRPEKQKQQLGRTLLRSAEEFARSYGARRIRMSVVNVRLALITWYERRGYHLTKQTEPFPYGDTRFGIPLRDDLHFVFLEKDLT